MQMIGEKCYVIAVKPGSDAEAKGVRVGDEVYTLMELAQPERTSGSFNTCIVLFAHSREYAWW